MYWGNKSPANEGRPLHINAEKKTNLVLEIL